MKYNITLVSTIFFFKPKERFFNIFFVWGESVILEVQNFFPLVNNTSFNYSFYFILCVYVCVRACACVCVCNLYIFQKRNCFSLNQNDDRIFFFPKYNFIFHKT